MRKIDLTILAVFFCCAAYAYEVSGNEARSVAARFFGVSESTTGLELVIAGSGSTTKSSAMTSAPEYYVFNYRGGGFVIISGDNAMRPILGYSETGSFPAAEELPDNVRWWLGNYAASVNDRRASNSLPDSEMLAMWADAGTCLTKDGTVEKRLYTVSWNQNSPFNAKCPKIGGKETISGCVPTAFAEIMCYYQWPAKGKGTIPSYQWNGTTLGGRELVTEYDWNNLKNLTDPAIAASAPEAVRQNLAQLLIDVGMSVKADYGLDATSAGTYTSLALFCEPFQYNKAARFDHRSFYDESVWEEMLMAEIDKNRPIYYSGRSEEGGHAFVIEGYDSRRFFYINFGWGPLANGFFWIGEDFPQTQAAVFDLVPDETGTSTSAKGKLYLTNYKINGLYTFKPSGMIMKSSTFSMSVYGVANDWNGDCSASLKLVHLDKDGNYIEDVSPSGDLSSYSRGYSYSKTFNNCRINQDIAFGDRIALYVRYSLTSQFEPIRVCKQGESVCYYPLTPYTFIDVKDSYSVGDRFMFLLKNNDFPYTWGLDNLDLHSEWYFYHEGKLAAKFTNKNARLYALPQSGNWTVKVCVRSESEKTVKTILSAAFTVR